MDKKFITHKGEIVTGERLTQAFNKVADDWIKLEHAIREEDEYADHVTEEEKDQILQQGIELAEQIRLGNISSVTVWQLINTALTGECVALLP